MSPAGGKKLMLAWDGKIFYTHSEKDGFFRFDWEVEEMIAPGTYPVIVKWVDDAGRIIASGEAHLKVPEQNRFTFISDIDDTFLISHSSTILKRLYVLFTENAYSRSPFEGVVKHYQMLEYAQSVPGDPNPFFYVSSSEWNLYDYLTDFIVKNNLPQGVFLLNQLKTFSQLFKTGKNNHSSKFLRIVRIIEAYPHQQFVLLGDDSQHDPFIYASIVQHFPDKIFCVYIRCVKKTAKPSVEEKIKEIESVGVKACYFMHSHDAMRHSQSVGLMPIMA